MYNIKLQYLLLANVHPKTDAVIEDKKEAKVGRLEQPALIGL